MKKFTALLYLTVIVFLPTVSIAAPMKTSAPTWETVQHRAFDFFWNESDPKTGLTKDRARNLPGKPDTYTVASVAATGYALASLPVGVSHGWVSRKAAYDRALTTLRFVHDKMESHHGFYYHFVDQATGARVWNCEVSSIDTALLLMGARTAGDYWPHTEIQRLADDLTDRADWLWMQTDGGAKPQETAPSMGWKPGSGFLASRWQGYSEAFFLYCLVLGSRTYPVALTAWNHWRVGQATVEGYPIFGGAEPLFMAQMASGFLDVQGQQDRQGRDWWKAWRNAHLADQAYCLRNPTGRKTYAEGFWGITACDQPPPVGYGANAPTERRDDGTVAPTAMLSGVMFTPAKSKKALDNLWRKHGSQLWGRYGFSNAFNVDKSWYDTDVIGIDLGMTLLAIENARTGLFWHLTSRDPVMKKGLTAAGFHHIRNMVMDIPERDQGKAKSPTPSR